MISRVDILSAKILIVDDEAANVMLLERLLQGADYNAVQSTQDPCAVCPLHAANRYDLIVLDLQMPVMDGFEVMESLKEIEADGYLPVLVVTAQPGHKLRALQSGAKDFITKPFDLVEVLARVHNLLEVRLLHRETKRLHARVVAEQAVSERLLLNVLPPSIAERLKEKPEVIADSCPAVTVLFADLVGFTKFSSGVSPERLVVLLNDIFTDYDTIADNCGLEKIKSIGDAYMAVAGLPLPVDDHAARAAHMAMEMLEALSHFNERNSCRFEIRIGINSGAVVAGVIGKRKFIYDLWGATVNTASRMESHGAPGRVHISDATKLLLSEPFQFEDRGTIDVKDVGALHTWFLTEGDRTQTLLKQSPCSS